MTNGDSTVDVIAPGLVGVAAGTDREGLACAHECFYGLWEPREQSPTGQYKRASACHYCKSASPCAPRIPWYQGDDVAALPR